MKDFQSGLQNVTNECETSFTKFTKLKSYLKFNNNGQKVRYQCLSRDQITVFFLSLSPHTPHFRSGNVIKCLLGCLKFVNLDFFVGIFFRYENVIKVTELQWRLNLK